ncbi:MAG: amidase, partial [Pseudomonadota bacterium]
MSALTELSLVAARDGLAARDFSAKELAQAHLDAIEAARDLNAFIMPTPERALAMAEESDRRLASGEGRPLEGLPIGVKDLFCTEGIQTTAGSHILEGFVPPYESTVTTNLWDAGAVLIGKTNLDEFAMGSSTVTSYFEPTVNPWTPVGDTTPLVPGGSSGGSTAAVAAHLCPAGLGTDTGGSIRQPAAFCGVVGMKPTYGRCSRFGIVAFASSLDQAGPITRSVEDSALLLQHMAGFDPKDSTSADRPLEDLQAALTGDVRGLQVGIPEEYRLDGTPDEILALWQQGVAWLKDAGCAISEVSLPHTK